MTVRLRHGGYLVLCPQVRRGLTHILLANTYPAARASLVAQTGKSLPVVWETWVRSLGWEDPMEEGMATHSSRTAWRIPMDCSPSGSFVHGEFSRQEYWSGLPCPPPWDLPNPRIDPRSPALLADSLPSEPPGLGR